MLKLPDLYRQGGGLRVTHRGVAHITTPDLMLTGGGRPLQKVFCFFLLFRALFPLLPGALLFMTSRAKVCLDG